MSALSKQDFEAAGEAIRAYLRAEGVFLSQSQALGVIGVFFVGSPAELEACGVHNALAVRKRQLASLASLLGTPGLQPALSQLGLARQVTQELAELADLLPESLLHALDVDTLLEVMRTLEYQARPELDLAWDHPLRLRLALVETLVQVRHGFDHDVGARLAAQFAAFTNRPGVVAETMYREKGWDATLKALSSEFGFTPGLGPVVIWSDREQGHWVDPVGWARDGWSATGYTPEAMAQRALGPGERWVLWSSLSKEHRLCKCEDVSPDDYLTITEARLLEFGPTQLQACIDQSEAYKEAGAALEQWPEIQRKARFAQQVLDAKRGGDCVLIRRLATQVSGLLPLYSYEDIVTLVAERGFDAAREHIEREHKIRPMLGSWLCYSPEKVAYVGVDGALTKDVLGAAGYFEKSKDALVYPDCYWVRFDENNRL